MMIALLLLLLLRLWGVAIVDAPPVAAARHIMIDRAATELRATIYYKIRLYHFNHYDYCNTLSG